jgi:hypothetical protein
VRPMTRNLRYVLAVNLLVVIPDWGLAWNIFSIEHAARVASRYENVYLLDLSMLNPKISRIRLGGLHDLLFRKNSIQKAITEICSREGIKLITPASNDSYSSHVVEDFLFNNTFKLAMASKYFWITGNGQTTLNQIDSKLVAKELEYFKYAYAITSGLILELGIDKVTTVNGRFLIDGAIKLAADNLGKEISLLESGFGNTHTYEEFRVSPHDISNRQEIISNLWKNGDHNKYLVAENGFKQKYEVMVRTGWLEKSEVEYSPPSGFTQKLAVFFPSTQIEDPIFEEIHISKTFSGDQEVAFRAFCDAARSKNFHVVVRVHPPGHNPKSVANSDNRTWSKICLEVGAEIVLSESPISSYSLIEKSDLCIVYISSIAIEIIAQEKPLLVLGETDYSHLIEENCAHSFSRLSEMLDQQIPTIEKARVFPWLYYYMKGGYQFKYFKVDDFGKYTYDNRQVDAQTLVGKFLKQTVNQLRRAISKIHV